MVKRHSINGFPKNKLDNRRKVAVENYRITMRRKHDLRIYKYYKSQHDRLIPLSDRELYVSGLFLYLGEGNKVSKNTISVSNSDPSVLKFVKHWFINSLKVSDSKIRMQLHLYSDMNVDKEIKFWLSELSMKRQSLAKPYIKKSLRSDIDQKGWGHGTCSLLVHDTCLKENLLMAIRAITDSYGVNPNKFDIIQ